MNSSTEARAIATEAIPLIEEQLALSEKLRALAKVATDKGFSWIGIRSYLKAQILDGQDGGDRVAKLLEKKGDELAIAEMLGGKNIEAAPETPPPVPPQAQGSGDDGYGDIPEYLRRTA